MTKLWAIFVLTKHIYLHLAFRNLSKTAYFSSSIFFLPYRQVACKRWESNQRGKYIFEILIIMSPCLIISFFLFVFALIQIIKDSHVAIWLIFCLRTKLYTKWNYEVQVNQVTSTIMQSWFVIMNSRYLTKLYALFTLLRILPLLLKSPLFSL